MQMDKAAVAGLVAIPLLFGAQAANAITSDQVRSLTYEEVKGTGLANRCTELTGTNGEISINSKNKFKIADLCLEPKSFQIEQEVNTRKKGGNSKGELRFCFWKRCLGLPSHA
jgi:photosystem II oxygen-evolving enhancer protein 1